MAPQFQPSRTPEDLEEARKKKFIFLSRETVDLTFNMNFSVSFRGTRRAFAYVRRFIDECKRRIQQESSPRKKVICVEYEKIVIPTIPEEIQAEMEFLRCIQKASFPQEYAALESNREISKDSKMISLAPFMKDGIIRVGGRINKASSLSFDARHQILLPRDHKYTNLLVLYFHSYRIAHMGPKMTLSAVRSRYWPIGGQQLTRKLCNKCVRCFKLRPKFMSQYMGDIPHDRLVTDEQRPFHITGVDFAGPIVVRHHMRCKVEKKVYLALFICFVTKAVHVELVPDLSKDAFLRALDRFVADRGMVAKIYSDNGKNFVGACNYLLSVKKMLQDNRDAIEEACNNKHIEWSFIPPRSPHHGGLWEASVKLLKRVIRNIVGDLNLTEDELHTIAKRGAAVINSRPITTLSSDPNDFEPLTPGHFLYGCSPAALPEVKIVSENVNSLSLAVRMKFAAQQLWNRFRKEYFHLLQPRTKWLIKTDQFRPGAVVLIYEDNADSLQWPLGRIVETKADKNGVVRVVKVRTVSGEYERTVNKIAVLPNESWTDGLTVANGGEDVDE